MNEKIYFPKLNEETSLGDFGQYLRGLNSFLDVTIALKKEARESGDKMQESMLGLKVKELHAFIEMLTFTPLIGHPQIALPAMAKQAKMLTIDASTIVDDIEEAKIIQAECEKYGHKEVIKATLHSPKQKSNLNQYEERVRDVMQQAKIDGVDLFTVDKKDLKAIRAKHIANPSSLTEEEHNALFADTVRQTLCELLGSGGRNEAVNFIRDYVFKPDPNLPEEERKEKEYSIADAHALLNALKDQYNINEPHKRQELVTNYLLIPKYVYLHIRYESPDGKRNDLTDYVRVIPKKLAEEHSEKLFVYKVGNDQIVCDVKAIKAFRKVNRYEERTTIKQLIDAYKSYHRSREEQKKKKSASSLNII